MSDWQGIESAPKDGTRIMVWAGAPYFVRWSKHCEFAQFENAEGWQIFECEDSFYSCGLRPDEPTHWMPLPPPPGTGGEEVTDG